ncbi:MAG TPA: M23 family metallopeptidase [Rhizomicrobium sp.]|jgi:murein DD-endopeptidase MepM/ murein hydrolase activator NlpD
MTDAYINYWHQSARTAAATFSSPDGRWAVASTSATALIAGSIAWLAMGIANPVAYHPAASAHALMPYEIFQRLVAQAHPAAAEFAVISPLGPVAPSQTARPPAMLDESLAASNDDSQTGDVDNDVRTVAIERGQSLVSALSNAGATDEDSQAASDALAKVFDLRALKAGETLDVTFAPAPPPKAVAEIIYAPPSQATGVDAQYTQAAPQPVGRLLSVTFSPTFDHDVTIAREAAGGFTAENKHLELQARFHRAGAKIDSSLYLAAMQAGIPARVVVQLIHMFSYEVDFQRDIKPGDSFEVYYDYYYTRDGRPAKEGEIAYAAMHLLGRTVALYRYQPKDEDTADFFDSRGQSAKSMLMKTPVDGARISSGFGMRFHPVLGYTRMHKGIDFAVPTGTPVMAAGAGTVQMEGWMGGYGNFMLLNHGNNYSTAYGHLSRFAPGLHQGSHVHQGQVIAYSGATGLATGPHLHYEIRINGSQVNPAAVKVAQGRILDGRELTDFQIARLHVDSEVASLPLEGKIADTATDLRAAKD